MRGSTLTADTSTVHANTIGFCLDATHTTSSGDIMATSSVYDSMSSEGRYQLATATGSVSPFHTDPCIAPPAAPSAACPASTTSVMQVDSRASVVVGSGGIIRIGSGVHVRLVL